MLFRSELDSETAWKAVVDSAKDKDLDTLRSAIKAYARAVEDKFSLQDVEKALRDADLPMYLIAMKQEIAVNHTIVDMIGNPGREFVLSFQLSGKPRRKRMAEGWPKTPEENMQRLASCGFVQDIGVPLCGNCGRKCNICMHLFLSIANTNL